LTVFTSYRNRRHPPALPPGRCGRKLHRKARQKMSDERRREREMNKICARCGARVKGVGAIEPVAGGPGVIAHEYPGVGYVTSDLSYPGWPATRVDQLAPEHSNRSRPSLEMTNRCR